jgi:hypothetical protein
MLVLKTNSSSSISKNTKMTGREKYAIFKNIKGSANTPSSVTSKRLEHSSRTQKTEAVGGMVPTPCCTTRHGALYAPPTTLRTPRPTPLLLLSPRLTQAENRAADEIFQGVRALLLDVPFCCELSPQGRFRDIRCLQPRQWLTSGIFTAVANPLSSFLSSIGPLEVS